MRLLPLRLLTWGTVATALMSAAWLSATNQNAVLCSTGYRASALTLGLDDDLGPPADRAGPPATPGQPGAEVMRQ